MREIQTLITNIYDKKDDFFESLFLKLFNKMQTLLQQILKSSAKQETDEKTYSRYVSVLRHILNQSVKLPYKKDYLSKFLIQDTIQILLGLDRPNFNMISATLLHLVQYALQAPYRFKRFNGILKNGLMIEFNNLDPKFREEIQHKFATQISELTTEKQELFTLQENTIKSLCDDVLNKKILALKETQNNGINPNIALSNIKNQCLLISAISLLAQHFYNNQEILQKLTNLLSNIMISGSVFSRNFAANRISEILGMKQHLLSPSLYIFKSEYQNIPQPNLSELSPNRFCDLTLKPELLYSKNLTDADQLFIDKNNFGWITIPPYLRFYNKGIGFSTLSLEQKKTELLYEMLNNQDFVGKLLSQALLDHESKEEQNLMKETSGKGQADIFASYLNRMFGNSDIFSTLFGFLFREPFMQRSKYFDPNQALFYQSCFEFYGPEIFRNFSLVIDAFVAAKEKSAPKLAISLEILCGFLRSCKTFEKSAMVGTVKNYCYETLIKIIKSCTPEFINDVDAGMEFFLNGRDPKRFSGLWKIIFENLLPGEADGNNEKSKFMRITGLLLNIWAWRAKDYAEEYLKWYSKNLVQDTEKTSMNAAYNFATILYKVYDYLKLDTVNLKFVEVASFPHKKTYEDIIKNLLIELQKYENLAKDDPANFRAKNIKLSLMLILSSARSSEANHLQSQTWILENLIPLCYQLNVFL